MTMLEVVAPTDARTAVRGAPMSRRQVSAAVIVSAAGAIVLLAYLALTADIKGGTKP